MQSAETPVTQEGETGTVQSELELTDPFVGLWTSQGWNVRMYSTGSGFYKNSLDPACNPNDTAGWRNVTYQRTNPDGVRVYCGETMIGGCYPNYTYVQAEFLISQNGRTMEERVYSLGLTNLFYKL